MYKEYSLEFKLKVVAEYELRCSYTETGQVCGVAPSSVFRWVAEHQEQDYNELIVRRLPHCRVCNDPVSQLDRVWGRGSDKHIHATCEAWAQGLVVFYEAAAWGIINAFAGVE